MSPPEVSVIIPVYNGAGYLGEAIRSVLNQTYADFELVIVSDASPDRSSEVVAGFDDSRIRFIEHDVNRGADAARNTGIRASRGRIIGFLDQDDVLHPDKLQAHIEHFHKYPETGLTYNSHFERNYSGETIREIFRPPSDLVLEDLVLGFPIPPSDMLISREWAIKGGLWDEAHDFYGGEIIFLSRLFLRGCKFSFVNRALNYRRHHSGRAYRDLAAGCRSELEAQKKVLADPLCPASLLAVRNIAFMNTYVGWASIALAQNETTVAKTFLLEAIRHNHELVEGKPCPLVSTLVSDSIADDGLDHETLLKRMFAQLPSSLLHIKEQQNWAIARGYLLKGTRSVIWDRPDDGRRCFERAIELKAELDETYLQGLIFQLISYEIEFGATATHTVLRRLSPYLERVGSPKDVRRFRASFFINEAFRSYQLGQTRQVPRKVIRAVSSDPAFLFNRGALSIFCRSALNLTSSRRSLEV